jgi:hypothetical protein
MAMCANAATETIAGRKDTHCGTMGQACIQIFAANTAAAATIPIIKNAVQAKPAWVAH